MSTRWNDIFQLPDAALAGNKRVPKTMLVAQAALTKHEQKTLDKMKRLEHFATATKATTRMLPLIDENRDIESIIYLRCEMASGTQAVSEVAHLIHKCFPNPTIVMQEAGKDICISVSLTRKSHAERGAVVIDRIESTGVFDSGAAGYIDLLDTLAFDKLPQDNLWIYLQTVAWRVSLSRVIDALGFYPQCDHPKQDRLAELVSAFDKAKRDVRYLQSSHKDPNRSLNESAKLRMQMKISEKKMDEIVAEIKELNND